MLPGRRHQGQGLRLQGLQERDAVQRRKVGVLRRYVRVKRDGSKMKEEVGGKGSYDELHSFFTF